MSSARRWLLYAVPLVALSGFVWFKVKDKKAEAEEQKKEQGARRGGASSVEIAIAQSRPLVDQIDAVGNAVSPNSISLSPRVAGRITFLEVREGDRVRVGQVLARIDPSEANARVLEQQANVSEARSRLAQAEVTQQSNRVQVEQNIRQARSEVARARADHAQVRAAVDGQVSDARADVVTANATVTSANAQVRNAMAQLQAANAQLANANTTLGRLQRLLELGYVAAQEVDDAKVVVAAAKAEVEVRKGAVDSANADLARAKAELSAAQTRVRTTTASGAAEVKAAQARIDQAIAAQSQAEANRAQNPAFDENINALRSGVQAAEAQLKTAFVGQTDTEIRAPIAGVITRRTGDPGSIATPAQAMLQLESLDWLFVNVTLPVSSSGDIVPGMPVVVKFDGLKDEEFDGKVDRAVPSADSTDRQFLLRVRLENPEGVIKPGMFARVAIETSRINARVVVPADAVNDDEVTVIDAENKASKRKVKVGRRSKNDLEILEGLKIGEKVVVLAFSPVRDGGKVNVTAERLSDGTRRVIEAPKPAQGRPNVSR